MTRKQIRTAPAYLASYHRHECRQLSRFHGPAPDLAPLGSRLVAKANFSGSSSHSPFLLHQSNDNDACTHGFPERNHSKVRDKRKKDCKVKNNKERDEGDNLGNGRNPKSKQKNGVQSIIFTVFLSTALTFGNFNTNHYFGEKEWNFRGSEALAIEAEISESSITSDQLFQSLSSRANSPTHTSSSPHQKRRYWDIMNTGTPEETSFANEKLMDHAVATINTMFYDSSGGANFDPKEFYARWKEFKFLANHPNGDGVSGKSTSTSLGNPPIVENAFATRENAVKSMKWLVSTLNDPYSKYLTREELRQELEGRDDGFLGLGALVEAPPSSMDIVTVSSKNGNGPPISAKKLDSMLTLDKISSRGRNGQWERFVPMDDSIIAYFNKKKYVPQSEAKTNNKSSGDVLSVAQASNLPIVTAIVPDSPAERAGVVVGDRIASVGTYQFTGMSRSQVRKVLDQKFHAENYFGRADLTIAKPIVARLDDDSRSYDAYGNVVEEKYIFENGWYSPRKKIPSDILPMESVLGYKLSHVKSIPTTLTAGSFKADTPASPLDVSTLAGTLQHSTSSPLSSGTMDPGASSSFENRQTFPSVVGGDAIVHYELLTPKDSIFRQMGSSSSNARPVGYIRLTRFSKASTAGYINAIKNLEEAGADSYILDLRNNYGGVIQEAMLTASTLLRDPHDVLCYTLNSRGGFRPQENMEYIIDKNYPGYFLSNEPRTVSLDQVRRENPEYLEDDGWSAPTSYASLRELKQTRGIKTAHSSTSVSSLNTRVSFTPDDGLSASGAGSSERKTINLDQLADVITRNSQKKLVILINEGTASAAEVFASALHDNGRTAALVGTKTFGKGLIQHTFPMPDGGGLRLTVAEYLTPSLHHVTKVGGAKYNSGIQPDVRCESNQGIPKNIGADLCVGVALDVLESSGSGI